MDERLKEIEDAVRKGEEDEEKLDLLSFLLKKTSWSPSQVVDNAVDLLGAGIDTVCQVVLKGSFTVCCVAVHSLNRSDVRETHIHAQCLQSLFESVTCEDTHSHIHRLICVSQFCSILHSSNGFLHLISLFNNMYQVFTSFVVFLLPLDCQHTPVYPVPDLHQPKYPGETESRHS